MVLLIDLEIARLPIRVAVHSRLNLNGRSVPYPVAPTGSLEFDPILFCELVLDERPVSIRSV